MKLIPPTSYDDYCLQQRKKYKRKRHRVWVNTVEWDFITEHIRQAVPELREGMCHGVRTGFECEQFSELLEIPVIGTEIGRRRHKMVVDKWDYHKTKPEWNERFSFVYSNSLDHSYDPGLALAAWATQLHPGGILILHWSDEDAEPSSAADCFGATLEEYASLLGVHCCDVKTIRTPCPRRHRTLVIGRRNETLHRDPRIG